MTNQQDESVIFERIIAERGGSTVGWSVIQLAAAQTLAQRLSRPTFDPRDIAALEALLPRPREGQPYDLDCLTDEELSDLERIFLKACNGAEPDPETFDRQEKIVEVDRHIARFEDEWQRGANEQGDDRASLQVVN